MTFIQTAMGGNYDTIKNAVKRLEGVGLLMQSEVPGKNKYILVELTDLGFSVAEHLKRANDLVLGVQPVDTAADIAGTGDIVVTNDTLHPIDPFTDYQRTSCCTRCSLQMHPSLPDIMSYSIRYSSESLIRMSP